MIHHDILELVGRTPLLELHGFDTGASQVFLKLEYWNPGGSIKDRIGVSMIENAERAGRIKPGDTLVEATAGNTGLGLALAAARKGYRLVLVIPDKMSLEKVAHLKAMGAEIVMTRSDVEKGHPQYYQDYARHLADSIPGAVYMDQFNNPDNPAAHEATTGPELWEQMEGRIDTVVLGVGSAGTIAGLSAFFAKVHPGIEFVLADPQGSILAEYSRSGQGGTPGSWLVEGIGEDFVPSQCDFRFVRAAYTIGDAEAFATARRLLREAGVFAGSSTGVLLAAALRHARARREPGRIVTFACDSGNKYLSKMYDDAWLAGNGCGGAPVRGDLTDLVLHRHGDRGVVTLSPTDSLLAAAARMRLHGVSQLPVLEDERVVGIVDEYDLLLALDREAGRAGFERPVATCMSTTLRTLPPDAGEEALAALLREGLTAIILGRDGVFHGLITKIDYINHLRLRAHGTGGTQNG